MSRRAAAFDWKVPHDALLLRLVKRGNSKKRIASRIGCSVNVVSYHLQVLRRAGHSVFLNRPWTAKELRQLGKLYRAGWKLDRISEKLGRKPAACAAAASRLRRAGVKLPTICNAGPGRGRAA